MMKFIRLCRLCLLLLLVKGVTYRARRQAKAYDTSLLYPIPAMKASVLVCPASPRGSCQVLPDLIR